LVDNKISKIEFEPHWLPWYFA